MQHHHGDDFPTHRQFLEGEQESFCDVVEREGNSQSWKEASGQLHQAVNFIWRSPAEERAKQRSSPTPRHRPSSLGLLTELFADVSDWLLVRQRCSWQT